MNIFKIKNTYTEYEKNLIDFWDKCGTKNNFFIKDINNTIVLESPSEFNWSNYILVDSEDLLSKNLNLSQNKQYSILSKNEFVNYNENKYIKFDDNYPEYICSELSTNEYHSEKIIIKFVNDLNLFNQWVDILTSAYEINYNDFHNFLYPGYQIEKHFYYLLGLFNNQPRATLLVNPTQEQIGVYCLSDLENNYTIMKMMLYQSMQIIGDIYKNVPFIVQTSEELYSNVYQCIGFIKKKDIYVYNLDKVTT